MKTMTAILLLTLMGCDTKNTVRDVSIASQHRLYKSYSGGCTLVLVLAGKYGNIEMSIDGTCKD